MGPLSFLLVVCLATAEPLFAQVPPPPYETGSPAQYDDLIVHQAAVHGLSPDLVRAVIQAESGFNPRAVSAKGAMGLMQLMPGTARALGVQDPFDPGENIRGGVTYLAQLLVRYNQNLSLALAAYNAGPAAVDRHGSVPLYRETQDYVAKIMAAMIPKLPLREGSVIYRWVELVDGEPRRRYSNLLPRDRAYEIVGGRHPAAPAGLSGLPSVAR